MFIVIGYYAAQKIGAIAVSVNAMLKRHEVKYIVNDACANVLLSIPAGGVRIHGES